MIKLEKINKAYKSITLFENLNLEINDGERIAISGVNGSGKSVLLKMICGYAKPDSGKVVVDGICINEENKFIQNAGISINAEDCINSMTGMENLLYLSNIKKIATKENILEIANKLYLKDLDKKYKNYSLGMKQKMRLIQALMEKPKYLILDEPFDALDDDSKEALINLLNELKDITLIVVSHDHESLNKVTNIKYKINKFNLEKINQ